MTIYGTPIITIIFIIAVNPGIGEVIASLSTTDLHNSKYWT
jgi:hypothetical protein